MTPTVSPNRVVGPVENFPEKAVCPHRRQVFCSITKVTKRYIGVSVSGIGKTRCAVCGLNRAPW